MPEPFSSNADNSILTSEIYHPSLPSMPFKFIVVVGFTESYLNVKTVSH